MNIIKASLLFYVVLLAFAAICEAADPDPFSEEPVATFESKLKAFSAQPTLVALRDLDVLCTRLPVRDKSPGQIGDGYPFDRDVKLTCMLQFVKVLDHLIEDNLHMAYLNVSVEGVPIAGMDPGAVQDPVIREKYIAAIKANNVVMEHNNFQIELMKVRKDWATYKIPAFIKYYCRTVDTNHVQEIIRNELKTDPKAKEVMASLLKAAGAS